MISFSQRVLGVLSHRQSGRQQLSATVDSNVSSTHHQVSRLWATRKVSYLLDQVRLHGDDEELLGEIDRLAGRGLDVAVLPVQAYSTLGWFADPLLDGMLAQSPARLAGSLLHELAHQRFYLRGDTAFSEAYASFVERAGVRAWLLHSGRHAEFAEWQAVLDAQRQFNELLLEGAADEPETRDPSKVSLSR